MENMFDKFALILAHVRALVTTYMEQTPVKPLPLRYWIGCHFNGTADFQPLITMDTDKKPLQLQPCPIIIYLISVFIYAVLQSQFISTE
jgi:hypothetical protein